MEHKTRKDRGSTRAYSFWLETRVADELDRQVALHQINRSAFLRAAVEMHFVHVGWPAPKRSKTEQGAAVSTGRKATSKWGVS